MFVGLGAMGLLSQWVHWVNQVKRNLKPRLWRFSTGTFLALFILTHGVLAPMSLPVASRAHALLQKKIVQANDSLPSGPECRSQTFVLVNTPVHFLFVTFLLIVRMSQDDFNIFRVLTAGDHPLSITRKDLHTIEVRSLNGSLTDLDAFVIGRKNYSMHQGQKVELDGVIIEVLETNDGLPSAASFTFSVPLSDSSLVWFQWQDGKYIPFTLPAVGETITVKGARFTMG